MDTYHIFLCICSIEVYKMCVCFFSLIVQVIRPRYVEYKIYITEYQLQLCGASNTRYEPFRSTRLYICSEEVSTCFLTPLATLLSVLPMSRGGYHHGGDDDEDDDDDFGCRTLPGPRISLAGFRPRRRPRRCLRRCLRRSSGRYCREIRSARHA